MLITSELERLYDRYVRLAQARKDKVLPYKDWLEYRSRLVGVK